MASYTVAKPCFLNGKRNKVGDTVEFEGKAPSYLKAIKKENKKKSD